MSLNSHEESGQSNQYTTSLPTSRNQGDNTLPNDRYKKPERSNSFRFPRKVME